jgi:hypothetical protein
VKDTVVAEAISELPAASLVALQVVRLRPKGCDECRFETAELLEMMQYLQGIGGSAPGARPKRWPASINHDLYLVREGTILSCKVRGVYTPVTSMTESRLLV